MARLRCHILVSADLVGDERIVLGPSTTCHARLIEEGQVRAMVHKASINIEADEKVRLHVRTMLEKLSAHLLAERVASVSPGPRISDKREGATPLGSGAGGKGQDTPQHGEYRVRANGRART